MFGLIVVSYLLPEASFIFYFRILLVLHNLKMKCFQIEIKMDSIEGVKNIDRENENSEATSSRNFGHYARQLTEEEIERLKKQDGRLVNAFKKEKLEVEAMKNWDKFYLRNETRFFKDRHWTKDEFKELCPDLNWQVRA
jgi:hypothetical protein